MCEKMSKQLLGLLGGGRKGRTIRSQDVQHPQGSGKVRMWQVH